MRPYFGGFAQDINMSLPKFTRGKVSGKHIQRVMGSWTGPWCNCLYVWLFTLGKLMEREGVYPLGKLMFLSCDIQHFSGNQPHHPKSKTEWNCDRLQIFFWSWVLIIEKILLKCAHLKYPAHNVMCFHKIIFCKIPTKYATCTKTIIITWITDRSCRLSV